MSLFDQFMGLFKKYPTVPYRKEDTTMSTLEEIRKTDKLSKNFRLSEFTKSQTASRLGIPNTPTDEHLRNIKFLVDNFLQPLRNKINKPLVITSGYRSEQLNHEIGGSETSQHSKGQAVDIECFGMSNKELATYIKNNMDFDQLILEFYNPDEGPNSGWVHVSYVGDENRNEVLSAIKKKGEKLRYVYGITSE
jgi:uncharacterized protein YcbK (DUF882 family)